MLFALLLGPATALLVPGLRSSPLEAPTCSQRRRCLPPLLASKQVDDREPTLRQWAAEESSAVAPLLTLYTLHAALKRALDGVGLAFPASIVGMLSGFGVLCAIRAWRARVLTCTCTCTCTCTYASCRSRAGHVPASCVPYVPAPGEHHGNVRRTHTGLGRTLAPSSFASHHGTPGAPRRQTRSSRSSRRPAGCSARGSPRSSRLVS